MGKKKDGNPEKQIVKRLAKLGLTVTTVESCTGGMVAAALTSVPGSSEVFKRGFVTYCDEAKHEMAGVRKKTLKKFTAVSRETAAEMAEGGAKAAKADCCISVTGYAGPAAGGSGSSVRSVKKTDAAGSEVTGGKESAGQKEKDGSRKQTAGGKDKDGSRKQAAGPEPVGLVYIGCHVGGKTKVRELHLEGDRAQIRAQARDEALRLLEKRLDKKYRK